MPGHSTAEILDAFHPLVAAVVGFLLGLAG